MHNAAYLVNNEVHDCLGNNIALGLVDNLEVRVDKIANGFHLALQLRVNRPHIIFDLHHVSTHASHR